MSSHFLSLSRRIRKTHFTDRVIENGVKGFTVYNHMLLPTYFKSIEEDYHHLKNEVQVWDVSCERQVQIKGKDAFKLLEMITPRNLNKLSEKKCLYVPLVNSKGFMVNDPVIIKVSKEKFWISIADSDVLLWIDGIVSALNLDLIIEEPDISPLAIQGPKSELLASKVFGSKINKLKLFDIDCFNFEGEELLVAKSGYSKQGGYEVYDAQIGFRNEQFTVIVYGENLGDEFYYSFINPQIAAGTPGDPEAYGVRLDWRL